MPTPSEKIKSQIKTLHEKERALLKELDRVRASKRFVCSCGKWHKIKECTVVQTHWYDPPQGCTEGGYWVPGELQIICPVTEMRNRVMFDDYDAPYELRVDYNFNAAAQFKHMYKKLFRIVVEEEKERHDYQFFNNDYFDENRKKFDLCSKYKEIKNER